MICFAVPLREHHLAFGQTVETLIITVPLERKAAARRYRDSGGRVSGIKALVKSGSIKAL